MVQKHTVLTGITPSGTPHIGNYIGCIKPALESQSERVNSLFFIADYHSLVKLWDAKQRQENIYEIAASWLALGLDPDLTIFYRQSDVPEILELNWILSSVAAKGLLNRAHAYKDQVAKNESNNLDADNAITMGLYCYPVLMAADILAFNADIVPVGKDQIQHVEIARDIAARINHVYKSDIFHLPVSKVDDNAKTIPGLDGRKMSKSYNNTIPIFTPSKKLRKNIMKIKTNSQSPEEPKDVEDCTIFNIYKCIADAVETDSLAKMYGEGIGWGDAKQILFEKLDSILASPRERYEELISDKAKIDVLLKNGASKARDIAMPILKEVKSAIGILL